MSFNVSVDFRLSQSRVTRMLRLPGGLVDRNLRRRVERVQAAAERLAPGSTGQGIRSSYRITFNGPVGTVTSTHPASIFVVSGTRPHIIRPRRPGGVLRFTVGGRVVYARLVHHPGTAANPFLTEALRAAL